MQRKDIVNAIIGGVVGAVLVILANSYSPLGAQNVTQDLIAGEIVCSGLTVVNGGFVDISSNERKPEAVMSAGRLGGYVDVWDNGGRSVAGMGASAFQGGRVYVQGRNGGLPEASMRAEEHDAAVNVFGKDGNLRAFMRVERAIYGNGEGAVGTIGRNRLPLATLK